MKTYIVDVETTGSNEPHITELAYSVVDVILGKVWVLQDPRVKRYNPMKPISLGSMAVSHICDEDVSKEEPHTDFKLPDNVNYMIGHNVDFDMLAIKNTGSTHKPKLICTLALSRFLLPELESHKLTALLYYFQKDFAREHAKNAHSALYDVKFTELVLDGLLELAKESGHEVSSIEDLYKLSEVSRTPTRLNFGKFKGESISELAKDFEGSKYLRWLLKQDNLDKYLKEACEKSLLDAK